ncbi:PXA domain containing protein, partial [Asbolus verrucosus]
WCDLPVMHVVNYFLLHWKPFTWSLIFLILICLSNQFFVLPLSGFYLLGYVVIVVISMTWISFVKLQNFLQQNKPLDLPKLLKFKRIYKQKDDLNNLTSIKQLTVDIDKYFIQKWFVYISKDSTFNEESRLILEEILNKMVNVQLSIDNEIVIQGVLNLYLKHLKEFRRSLKRKEKYLGKISDLYRYSHVCSNSKKAKNYFIHQLTINLLNHFINWELGNSLPYQILVSIISKKVMTYILNLLSNPEFLNYYILNSCASENKRSELKLDNYNRVKIIQITEKGDVTPSDPVKSVSKLNLTKITPSTDSLQLQKSDDVDGKKPGEKQPINLDYSQIKSEEVKIYEPKSCKTWYDSYDLASVPLGQDILDIISVGDSDKDKHLQIMKKKMHHLR